MYTRMYIEHTLDYEGGLSLIHLAVEGTSGCSLRVSVIQIQYVFRGCLTTYS